MKENTKRKRTLYQEFNDKWKTEDIAGHVNNNNELLIACPSIRTKQFFLLKRYWKINLAITPCALIILDS